MKTLLLLPLLLLLALSCPAASPVFKDFDGSQFGTNANKIRLKPGVIMTNAWFRETLKVGQTLTGNTNLLVTLLGNGVVLWSDGVPVMVIGPGGVGVSTNFVVGGTISGNGGGLSNLPPTAIFFIENVTNNVLVVTNIAYFNSVFVTNNATFNGKVTLNSNVYVLNLIWFTNAQSTLTINAAKAMEVLSTNNNMSFTGYSGLDGTNSFTFTRIYTNTAGSAAVKSITFPVGTLMLSPPFTNVVYLTNQGVFSGVIYPGFGTNGTWTGN